MGHPVGHLLVTQLHFGHIEGRRFDNVLDGKNQKSLVRI